MLASLKNASLAKSIRAFHSDEEGNEMIQTVAIVAVSMIILAFVYRTVWGGPEGGSTSSGGIMPWLKDMVSAVTKWAFAA
jgi:hypothetical protein